MGATSKRTFPSIRKGTTPAEALKDGYDFVPMSKSKNAIIELLNIAGTGPIFGPIMGALYGPVAYIWIVVGCIFGGAVHDYMIGMISLRNDGAHLPKVGQQILGQTGQTCRQHLRHAALDACGHCVCHFTRQSYRQHYA